MIVVLTKKITTEQLKKASQDLEDYVKFVVDVEKQILAAGGKMHTDCEKELLNHGSKQEDLWGGGWDLQTNELDEVLSAEVRAKITEIVEKLLL